MSKPAIRSASISSVALVAAASLATALLSAHRRHGLDTSPSSGVTDPLHAEVAAALPDDPGLAARLTSRWTNVARAVARAEGGDGLKALDLFGEEAAEIFSRNPSSFTDLAAIVRLDSPLREASVGPWREAVLQWARGGHLGDYLDHLARLDSDERELLAETPGSLPLLGRGAATAEAMLSRYGVRAWRLFLVVDFAEEVAGVERVANALATYGDRMLRVNESYGPALAFLFVPPVNDASGHLPRLFAEAIDRLGIEDAAALFLSNYDDLARLVLVDGHMPEEVVEAIDVLAGQPEEVRALAPDSGRVLRLLMERRGREPIGAEILARCGPEAADLLFEDGGYAGRPQGKAAALAILSRRGWPGLELLRTFRDDESWHRLLRREDLMGGEGEPLIVRLAGKLEHSPGRQDEIERYLSMPRDQIVGLDIPPTFVDRALDWVPGYLAVHTAYNASRGYRVETSEIALAVIDGVTTATFVGKLAGQTIKTVGLQVAKAEIQSGAREVAGHAARQFAANERREGAKSLLTRLPGVLRTLTRSLPKQLPTLNVTSVVRSSSAVAKKVGVRTWGKLDRRIIMRGDRMVVIDLFNPQVISQVGEEVRDTAFDKLKDAAIDVIQWKIASMGVGELSPCIMERVLPKMWSEPDEPPHPRGKGLPPSVADSAPPGSVASRPSDHPAFTPLGSILMVVCLALAIPRIRGALARRIVPGPKRSADRPGRRYEE